MIVSTQHSRNISEPCFINWDDKDDDDKDDGDYVHSFEEGLQCGVVNPSWSGGNGIN